MLKTAAIHAAKFLLAIVIVRFVLTIGLPTFYWKLVESIEVGRAQYQARSNPSPTQDVFWGQQDAALLQHEQLMREMRGY